ncbi:Txe/YoeB family addiction module toxin [Ekhidna sp.]|uniref:Txe/YoeB family addiction module toxin n=1 Tax=Ekhidna sp. TaxID=2608089 RepID=UPI003B50CDC4
MKIVFLANGWEDYLYWQKQDKKILKKVNELIKDCQRSPFDGIGKPEALKNDLSGWWSRRITQEQRLVYRVENNMLYIAQCRKHY